MKRMSKLFIYSLTSLTVLASGVAAAEEMVIVPTLEGGVTASVGTFLVVPSANNTTFSNVEIFGDEEDVTVLNSADAKYNFGWEASLGYIFEDTANEIELNYRGLSTNDTATTHIPANGEFEGGSFSDKLKYQFDSADLMIKQYIDIGQHMQMRMSGGLAYLHLKQTQQLSDSNKEEDEGIQQTSKFNGWGPRVALDGRYGFNEDGDDSGFGIVGGASLAYFLGTNKASTQVPNDEEGYQENLDNQSVTNLRANLGIDYVYFFDNEQSTIGLELGYLVDYYADAIATIDTQRTGGQIISSVTDTTSLTFSGPYLNLKGVF